MIHDFTLQPELFTRSARLTPPSDRPTERERRKDAMDAAFAHADERFKAEYAAVLDRFVERRIPFCGEDVQEYYKSDPKRPLPRNWRSVGFLYTKLQREGRVEIVGYRKRSNGNPTAVYVGI